MYRRWVSQVLAGHITEATASRSGGLPAKHSWSSLPQTTLKSGHQLENEVTSVPCVTQATLTI
jgi:hypothetical protein